MKHHILIIEDEAAIADILCYALNKEGYDVTWAADGQQGLQLINQVNPAVVILDLMLPDISGFELCKTITAQYQAPIIMLTARNDIVDKIMGLELGADDYITKPFDIREVMARVRVVLRRIAAKEQTNNASIQLNSDISIDPRSHTVYQQGREIRLKPKEYQLLLLLSQHKNRVFTRDEILDRVWGMDYYGDDRTVDVHVRRLRKKLDQPNIPSIIETVFGVGYKMKGLQNENID